MGLESLYVFTMLGGVAAGAYAFETGLRRRREGGRPWLVPLVVVILFAAGIVAAATHVHSIPRAIQSVVGGTVNFGSGMIREVLVAGCFMVLAAIDLVVTFVRKDSPYGLRVVGAVVGVVCMVMMGVAYTDVYGIAVWCDAPATILAFLAGDLAMGLALFAVLGSEGYDGAVLRIVSFVVNAALAVGRPCEPDCGARHRADRLCGARGALAEDREQARRRCRHLRRGDRRRGHLALRVLRNLHGGLGKQGGIS